MLTPFSDPFSNAFGTVFLAGLIGLFTALVFRLIIGMRGTGTEKMQMLSRRNAVGVSTFINTQFRLMIPALTLIALALYLFLDVGMDNLQSGTWTPPLLALIFLAGAACVSFVTVFALHAANAADVRTTHAARTSLAQALRVAFLSSAGTALAATGVTLMGLTGAFLFLTVYRGLTTSEAVPGLSAFLFGLVCASLFLRVAGSVFASGTLMGADLAAGVDSGLLSHDPRNPAETAFALARQVHGAVEAVCDGAEKLAGALVAATMIALYIRWLNEGTEAMVLFPFFVISVAVIAVIFGAFAVHVPKGSADISGTFKSGMFLVATIVAAGSFFIAEKFLANDIWLLTFIALMAGLVGALLIGMVAEYFASDFYAPAKRVMEQTKSGPALAFLSGCAVGFRSVFWLTLVLLFVLGVAYRFSTLYGIQACTIGMMTLGGMFLAVTVFGSVVRNAGDIARRSQLPRQVFSRTDTLSGAAAVTGAVANRYSVVVGGLVSVALFWGYFTNMGSNSVNAVDPYTLACLLFGAVTPFLFVSRILTAVERTSASSVSEIRRQWKEVKGLRDGTTDPDARSYIRTCVFAAIKRTIVPVLLLPVLQIVAGMLFGTAGIAALLIGMLLTGIPLALFLTATGGLFDSARIAVEAGNLGGEGSEAHRTSCIVDRIGSPLRHTAGSSLTTFFIFMIVFALLMSGFFRSTGALG